ncbi:acyl-CoA dehydrogenase family protein [Agromyces sp. NPDC058110]|uniref:acyl-CoA dehydrogenase family protein n=1 Tax=Agromyces sp. NPDC058110 TaxID=3346345 RepID=UPI0036DC6EF9
MSAQAPAPDVGTADVVAPLGRASVAAFDGFLGRPDESGSVITEERSVQLDEASAFPVEAVAAVDGWGLQRAYVPEVHGGGLGDVFVPMMMIRRLASRDLTVAVAHGKTFLGAVGAWIAGGPIAADMADIVLAGDPVSWGLTEQGRGSDLSSTATTAAVGDSIRVTGTKWPINNATRGRAMTVLARTGDAGPRALSLVLVDKHRVDAGTLAARPKVATHGIRGADISGLELRGTRVERDRLVGAPGHGLEIVLKSLQLTRPLTTALSLGAADHAIAVATAFASGRSLFGRSLGELPTARATLGTAIADALLAEAVMYAGARGAHRAPEEMSLVSALVKFLVPDTVDLMFRDLTPFVGARSQLIGIAGAGGFQKAARDNRVVGIFDGNSVVNLNMIVNEFPSIAREGEQVDVGRVVADFAFDGPADAWVDTASLRLVTKRGTRMLRALPGLVDLLGSRPAASPARRIAAEADRLVRAAGAAPRESAPSAASFDLAERISLCFGAACAVATELASPERGSAPSEVRLTAVLDRIAVRLGLHPSTAASGSAAALADLAFEEAGRARSVSMLDGWADAA